MSGTSMSVLIALGAFSGIFGIVYVFLMTRYKERIAMIEKGVDASIFVSNNKSISPTLKFGMLFVGIALGIIIGDTMHEFYGFSKGAAFFSMVFLFGGISLILNFIIERKLTEGK